MAILDLHTHHVPPQPEGIVSVAPRAIPSPDIFPGQCYSVGIHPWDVKGVALSEEEARLLREVAAREDVVAVGETGVDRVRHGVAPLAGQLNAFRIHAELAEELCKPLVIHCVKGHDAIIALKRAMKPRQPWIIHGFRGKPSVMRMFAGEGIYLSLGVLFNSDSLIEAPSELILAETDEAPVTIRNVIAGLSAVCPDVTPDLIAANMRSLFS